MAVEKIQIMRNLLRVFGLSKSFNERGFVFLELAVGLPFIVVLLWTMSSLFANTWNKGKSAMADFILQQEMESAMARIVDVARIAYKVEPRANGMMFYYYEMDSSLKPTSNSYVFFVQGGDMHRGRTSGVNNPITGNDNFSNTMVTKFYCSQIPGHDKLLKIRIEAMSNISRHKVMLTTTVFMKGLKTDE